MNANSWQGAYSRRKEKARDAERLRESEKRMSIKHVKAKYIESGAFQAAEEDVFRSGIKYGEKCVVITKADFNTLSKTHKDWLLFQQRLNREKPAL